MFSIVPAVIGEYSWQQRLPPDRAAVPPMGLILFDAPSLHLRVRPLGVVVMLIILQDFFQLPFGNDEKLIQAATSTLRRLENLFEVKKMRLAKNKAEKFNAK